MWSKLAKHSEVNRPKAAQSPQANPPPLQWHRNGEWAMESQDKRYRVSKALVFGKPHYQAYHLPPSGEWYFCIGGDFSSFDLAKAAVERHRRKE